MVLSELSCRLLPPAHQAKDAASLQTQGGCLERSDVLRIGASALIILMGVGGHAGKNAISPAEPALKQEGMSPQAYGVLVSVPVAAGIVAPLLWGAAYGRSRSLALTCIPAGLVVGQAMLVVGLRVQEDSSPLGSPLLAAGLLAFSICRSGIGVLQHTELAKVLPVGDCLTKGFIAMIACTHLIIIACNWVVPRLVFSSGVLGMQTVLLCLSMGGAAAACCLVNFREKTDHVLPDAEAFDPPSFASSFAADRQETLSETSTTDTSIADLESSRCEDEPSGSWLAVILICIWKALILGFLKSFGSLSNALCVDRGLTSIEAGDLNAYTQSLAILTLPLVGVFIALVGQRFAMLIVSVFTASSLIVLWGTSNLAIGLFMVSVAGVVAAVLPLTMLPSSMPRKGTLALGFGFMDCLFMGTEMALNLSFGALREGPVGFSGVFMLSFGVVVVSSICATLFLLTTTPPAHH